MELILGMKAELVASGLYVAAPVALSEDIVFIIVQGSDMSCESAVVLSAPGDEPQHGDRCLDAYPPWTPHGLTQLVAERGALIDFSVREEVFPSRHAVVESQEDSLYHVLDIYEGDVLPFEAYRKVDVLLDAFGHEVVVLFPWTIHTGGSENDIVEFIAHAVEEFLGHEFTAPVCGVGSWRIVLGDVVIGLLFPDGPEDAQTTHVDEASHRHVQFQDGFHQIACSLVVHAEEVVGMQAFRHTGGMYDIVEIMSTELLHELVLGVEVQFDEVDARVLQIGARAALAHGGPCIEASSECFLNDKTANEATGTGNENVHSFYLLTKILHISDFKQNNPNDIRIIQFFFVNLHIKFIF